MTTTATDRTETANLSAETEEDVYAVGYRKPPRHTQFKKGQSGNPRGVRKPMSVEETAASIMRRTAIITEKGKRRRVTMQEALLLGQMKKGIEGDHKPAKLILDLAGKAPAPQEGFTCEEEQDMLREAMVGMTVEELETLSDFNRRLGALQERRRGKKP